MIALWIVGAVFLAICVLGTYACCVVAGMAEEQDEIAYEEFIREQMEAGEELNNID